MHMQLTSFPGGPIRPGVPWLPASPLGPISPCVHVGHTTNQRGQIKGGWSNQIGCGQIRGVEGRGQIKGVVKLGVVKSEGCGQVRDVWSNHMY